MTDADQYSEWDAAYVLGALSLRERGDYEAHLTGCERCRASVAELAGLPGLLGQLSPGEAIAVESVESGGPLGSVGSGGSPSGERVRSGGPANESFAALEPPASLMPRLPRTADPRQRWLAPIGAAAAALLIGGIGGYAASASRDAVPDEAPTSTLALARSRLAFVPVKSSPMTAVVDIVPTGEGTELRVECQYAPSATSPSATTDPRTGDGGYTGVRYAIWVVGRDGREVQVKDWTARSGRIMHPSGVTSWAASQISAVEIRLAGTNEPVMRARLT